MEWERELRAKGLVCVGDLLFKYGLSGVCRKLVVAI